MQEMKQVKQVCGDGCIVQKQHSFTSGFYTWTIVDFLKICEKVQNPLTSTTWTSLQIKSPVFRLCGHDWKLEFHPFGCSSSEVGFASLFLQNYDKDVSIHVVTSLAIITRYGQEIGNTKTSIDSLLPTKHRGWSKFIQNEILFSPSSIGYENLYHRETELVIQCKISFSGAELGKIIWDKPQHTRLSQQMGGLLDRPCHSDIVFSLDGKQLEAHRAILSIRSPVFSAMFSSGMKESKEKVIVIEDAKFQDFKRMIYFIYTGNFPFGLKGPTQKDEKERKEKKMKKEAGQVENLLVLSHRYEIMDLVKICELELESHLTAKNANHFLQLATTMQLNNLKKKAFEFMQKQFSELTDKENLEKTSPEVLQQVIQLLQGSKKRSRESNSVSESTTSLDDDEKEPSSKKPHTL